MAAQHTGLCGDVADVNAAHGAHGTGDSLDVIGLAGEIGGGRGGSFGGLGSLRFRLNISDLGLIDLFEDRLLLIQRVNQFPISSQFRLVALVFDVRKLLLVVELLAQELCFFIRALGL